MATPGKKDIKVTASDALEFEPVAPRLPKKRWGLRLFLLLMVAGGSAWGWQNYGEWIISLWGGTDGGIPLVKAAAGPVKVRPENPGGLRVPDRDKLVYDRIQGKNGDPEAPRGPERLLPPPEQPLPKPGAKKAVKAEPEPQAAAIKPKKVLPKAKPAKKKPTPKTKPVAKVPTVKDVTTAKRPVPPPPPAAPPKATSPKLSLAKQTAKKEEDKPPAPVKKAAAAKKAPAVKPKTPVPASPPTETARAAPSPAPKPIPRGSAYLVQLAAARSREGAKGEWNRLRAKNLDLLGDLRLTVTKADLGPEKGVFYRLRAGPLADEPTARRLCSRLSTRQVGCLIIKPGQ